jgi:excisionase family DNA binding protein
MERDTELLLTANAAARRLSVGRTKVFELLGSGELPSVQIGRLRRIPARALNDYVNGLIADQIGEGACDDSPTSVASCRERIDVRAQG